MTNQKKLYYLLIIFSLSTLTSFAKQRKNGIKLIPNTDEYELYMNKIHCDQICASQRAWMYSALVPGLGQIQNKQPLRAVVIWGVFAGLLGGAYYCHNEYVKYFHDNTHNPPSFVKIYKKVRNSLLFVAGVWYVANIIDAYVGARLLVYDISNNVSVQIVPHLHSSFTDNQSVGISLGFNFK